MEATDHRVSFSFELDLTFSNAFAFVAGILPSPVPPSKTEHSLLMKACAGLWLLATTFLLWLTTHDRQGQMGRRGGEFDLGCFSEKAAWTKAVGRV